MSSRRIRGIREGALALAAAWAVSGCGPAEADWKLVSDTDLSKIPTMEFVPSGRPTTMPTTFPSTYTTKSESLEKADVSLVEVRQWALQSNFDLDVAVVQPEIARTRVSEEEARFESTFFADAYGRETDRPGLNGATSPNQTLGVEPGIRIPLRTGGTVELSSPFERVDTNTDTPGVDPTYYQDGLEASISHPLLRNAGRETSEYSIRLAGYDHEISRARARLEVTRVLAAVDRVYWRLYAAREQLKVAKQQYELAYALLERTERELKVGRNTQVELVRAQSGAADRVDEIITAENLVLQRQRELKRLINQPQFDEDTLLTPTTEPDATHFSVNAEQMVNAAMQNRSEMLEQELRLAQETATIRFSRNQMLPLLSATYTYRISGVGDLPSDAYDMTFQRDYQDHTVGLRLDVPIGNEQARSRLRRAQLQRLQQLSSRSAQALLVRTEVLDAVDQIETAWQRIVANRARTVLAARTLEAEQRQAEAGVRTNTDVLDALTRLADAQFSEIRALADYQIARIDLAYATGTLLGHSHVDWERTVSGEVNKANARVEETPR